MRSILMVFSTLFMSTQVFSQSFMDLTISENYYFYELLIREGFEDSTRLSVTNFTRWEIDGTEIEENTILSFASVNVRLLPHINFSAGGYLEPNTFSPLLGFNYYRRFNQILLNGVIHTGLDNAPIQEVILGVTREAVMSKKISLFAQGILALRLKRLGFQTAEQSGKFGVSFLTFQFGISAQFRQNESEEIIQRDGSSIGLFVRKSF